MLRSLPLGLQNFATIRENNCFYVDKTKFIRDWWNRCDDVTLITRPSRLGKTLMLDTVNTFFSPEFAGRSDLFYGLEIFNDEKFRNLQGTVPVIYLSFADIKETTLENTIISLKKLLALKFRHFSKLLDISKLSDWEKKIFASVHEDMSDISAKRSLCNL
ncbi:MAG: AAA family ATPase [Desulfovibrionaceae bacterium]|nr:AAA family ATPase [Desulfovibrionaceae bacterium]